MCRRHSKGERKGGSTHFDGLVRYAGDVTREKNNVNVCSETVYSDIEKKERASGGVDHVIIK
jgi:hypothetical protein